MQKYACLQAYKCMCIYINGETCVCMCKNYNQAASHTYSIFLKKEKYISILISERDINKTQQ